MDIRDRRSLKSAAAEALSFRPGDAKKLILLHTGIVLVFSLVLTVVDYLLGNAIAGTGGLGGVGKRAVLETVQSCLRLAQMILLPFWQIGYSFVTLRFARQQRAYADDLSVGFTRFSPVLRLFFLQGAIHPLVALIASYGATFLFMMTPWSAPLSEAAMELMNSSSMEAINAAVESAVMESFLPLMVCYIPVFLILQAPFFYCFRIANFVLLDNPEKGALHAIRTGRRLMRGNIIKLFVLDLSFWWFYGLDLLVGLICYADVLLALLGVSLPVSADVAFFVTFGLYLLCQLGLYVWRRNEVSTTYALFYDALLPPQEDSQNM